MANVAFLAIIINFSVFNFKMSGINRNFLVPGTMNLLRPYYFLK